VNGTPRTRSARSAARALAGFIALGGTALAAQPARAQEPETHRPHLLRASLGGGKLLGAPQNDDFRLGFGFGVGYEYRFHRMLGVGGDYAGHLFPVRASGVSGVGTLHAVGATLTIHPLPAIELGDLHFDVGPDLVITGGLARFGLHAGAAFDFRISDLVAVGPFVRYRHAFTPGSSQADSDPKLLSFGVELTLALGGGEPDATPEPLPPSDRDEDGLVDADDGCPDQAETPNDFEDADGCPDTLPVAEPEPEPVPEVTEPEPVETPPVVEPEPTPSPALELPAMGCDVGEAAVRDSHSSELDEIAQTMRDNPSMRILLIGHADSVGTTEANEDLSRRRAHHVRDELVRRGIESHRIRMRWYGERHPLDPGDDESARANNRRVEILVDGD
jgi:outer membrane protein OmpA-like peptidoglycan-associated protein